MRSKDPVRLSSKEALILGLLIREGSEMYGLQLVERSHGELARGTVYVTLERMAERGMVESRQEEKLPGVPGIPRRLYRPSGLGQRVYRAWELMQRAPMGVSPALG